jgi:hypothetical protein
MKRRRDMGRWIRTWAANLNDRQLAELLAMWWSQTAAERPSMLAALLAKDQDIAGLIRAKFITWKRPLGNQLMRESSITKIGMLVLHARIETELLASGAIKPAPQQDIE